MTFRVQWTASALDRLIGILDFIAEERPRAAVRAVDEILDRVEILAQFPQLGPVFSEESGPDLRRLIIESYLIVYQIQWERKVISVVTVRHSRQRPLTLEDLEDYL